MNFAVQHVIIKILEKPAVYNNLLECENFNFVVNLHSLPPSNNSGKCFEHVKFAVYDNIKIIHNYHWVELCF